MSFYLNFDVKNPFFKKAKAVFKSIFHKDFRLSKTRNLDIDINRHTSDNLIDFTLDLRMSGKDHAGPRFQLSILGATVEIGVPDARHWDYKNDCWLMYWKDFEAEFQRILSTKKPSAEPVTWADIWEYGESGLSPEESVKLWLSGKRPDIGNLNEE